MASGVDRGLGSEGGSDGGVKGSKEVRVKEWVHKDVQPFAQEQKLFHASKSCDKSDAHHFLLSQQIERLGEEQTGREGGA